MGRNLLTLTIPIVLGAFFVAGTILYKTAGLVGISGNSQFAQVAPVNITRNIFDKDGEFDRGSPRYDTFAKRWYWGRFRGFNTTIQKMSDPTGGGAAKIILQPTSGGFYSGGIYADFLIMNNDEYRAFIGSSAFDPQVKNLEPGTPYRFSVSLQPSPGLSSLNSKVEYYSLVDLPNKRKRVKKETARSADAGATVANHWRNNVSVEFTTPASSTISRVNELYREEELDREDLDNIRKVRFYLGYGTAPRPLNMIESTAAFLLKAFGAGSTQSFGADNSEGGQQVYCGSSPKILDKWDELTSAIPCDIKAVTPGFLGAEAVKGIIQLKRFTLGPIYTDDNEDTRYKGCGGNVKTGVGGSPLVIGCYCKKAEVISDNPAGPPHDEWEDNAYLVNQSKPACCVTNYSDGARSGKPYSEANQLCCTGDLINKCAPPIGGSCPTSPNPNIYPNIQFDSNPTSDGCCVVNSLNPNIAPMLEAMNGNPACRGAVVTAVKNGCHSNDDDDFGHGNGCAADVNYRGAGSEQGYLENCARAIGYAVAGAGSPAPTLPRKWCRFHDGHLHCNTEPCTPTN